MKRWQETRNYRRIRDKQGVVIANIITVDGVDVEVTEEVYLAYSQAERRERYLSEDSERTNQFLSLLSEKHRSYAVITGNWNTFPDGPCEKRKAMGRMCQDHL